MTEKVYIIGGAAQKASEWAKIENLLTDYGFAVYSPSKVLGQFPDRVEKQVRRNLLELADVVLPLEGYKVYADAKDDLLYAIFCGKPIMSAMVYMDGEKE